LYEIIIEIAVIDSSCSLLFGFGIADYSFDSVLFVVEHGDSFYLLLLCFPIDDALLFEYLVLLRLNSRLLLLFLIVIAIVVLYFCIY
jgi:hypothetical protein